MASATSANNKIAVGILVVAFSMLGLSFAAVPLYDLFCRVTGIGGTPQVVIVDSPYAITQRTFQVDFDANIDKDLPWKFEAADTITELQGGKTMLVNYTIENLSNEPVTGQASFNVTPLKAGKYFAKMQCFCFVDQTLQAGEKIELPVQFYIDPAIQDDKNMKDVRAITLSYTMNKVTN